MAFSRLLAFFSLPVIYWQNIQYTSLIASSTFTKTINDSLLLESIGAGSEFARTSVTYPIPIILQLKTKDFPLP